MTPLPATATFAEFARLARFKPSYVTQLKRDERLVLTEDGKAVKVPESLERIRETRDPGRQDVAERHASEREITVPVPPAKLPEAESSLDPEDYEEVDLGGAGPSYQRARAVKEHFLAMKEKRDYEISMGKLMDAEEVGAVVADAVTALRASLELIPDVYAAQLAAESGEASVRAVLADAIQHALEEASRQLAKLAREDA